MPVELVRPDAAPLAVQAELRGVAALGVLEAAEPVELVRRDAVPLVVQAELRGVAAPGVVEAAVPVGLARRDGVLLVVQAGLQDEAAEPVGSSVNTSQVSGFREHCDIFRSRSHLTQVLGGRSTEPLCIHVCTQPAHSRFQLL